MVKVAMGALFLVVSGLLALATDLPLWPPGVIAAITAAGMALFVWEVFECP